MTIDIDPVARLARIDLDDAERALFAEQLAGVLQHVEVLRQLDTEKVEPLVHAMEQPNVFRPDTPLPGLSTTAALDNAPAEDGEFFLVPRVLD